MIEIRQRTVRSPEGKADALMASTRTTEVRRRAAVAVLLLALAGCSKGGPGQGPAGGFKPPPMPVETAAARLFGEKRSTGEAADSLPGSMPMTCR